MTIYKEGDLVRVQGSSFNTEPGDNVRHHIKAGAVCTVVRASTHGATISGPIRKDCRPGHESRNNNVGALLVQGVNLNQIKLAKQAMKKRDLYAARR